MSSTREPSGALGRLVAKVSLLLYVAACLVAMVLRPSTFMLVGVTVVILYHAVLVHAAFIDILPSAGSGEGRQGHPVMTLYRRAAPVLGTLGVLLLFVDVPSLGEQIPGLLIASGTALAMADKMIAFAGTDAR